MLKDILLGMALGLFALWAFFVFQGCSTQPRAVDGTSIQLGAYIPWNENLYGLELISYVSGLSVKCPTNQCYEIEREHSSTNVWLWGFLESHESGKSTVKLLP